MVQRCDTALYRNAAICLRVISAEGQNRVGSVALHPRVICHCAMRSMLA